MAKKPAKKRGDVRAQAIHALEDRNGRIAPEAVVRAARNPGHPLHGEFEWNDGRAAERYRLDQARTLIASVRIVITRSNKKLACVGYLRDLDAAPKAGYIATLRLRSNHEASQDTLAYEIQRAQAILERVKEIATALGLEGDYDRAMAAVVDFSSRVRRGRPPKHDGAEMRPS